MDKTSKNQENLQKYKERLKEMGKLPRSKETDTGKLLVELLKEGHELIAKESTKSPTSAPVADDKKKLDTTLAASSSNPYIRAHAEVLSKLPEWRQREILRMEQTKDVDNRYYSDFVHDVRELGDSYSS